MDGEPEVLRLAADILQRKVGTVITGAVGKTATQPIVEALVNCGAILNTIEMLREVADAFDGGSEDSDETEQDDDDDEWFDPTDFGAELQRQVDASPELAKAVFEASVEIDRESARYKELKKRVLEWLREKRDEDGTGCCYGLKTIADEMKCTMGELVDWDHDYGVLFDLGREGNISWTAGQDCVYAVGGRTTWDEF